MISKKDAQRKRSPEETHKPNGAWRKDGRRGFGRVARSSLVKRREAGQEAGVKDNAVKCVESASDRRADVPGRNAGTSKHAVLEAEARGGAAARCEGKAEDKKGELKKITLVAEGGSRGSAAGMTGLGGGLARKKEQRGNREGEGTDKGVSILNLARSMTDLADRIPYSGVLNSDPSVWEKFNDSLARETRVSGIRKQWLWLTRQVCLCLRCCS